MVSKVIEQLGGAETQAEALKKRIVFAEDTIEKRKNTYYVSDRGDDSSDGCSPERPIKSYMHVADLPLEAGDSVLFERGSVFRASEKLWVKSNVYFGAYGEGEKPHIYGSLRDYADPSIWKQTENEAIWCTEISHTGAGVITFNYDEYVGVWRYTKPELKNDGDFYHDIEKGVFYLYFEGGNPGEYFENIEISTTDIAIRGSYIKDIYVENILFKYYTVGPFLFGEISDITVTDCVMGWCGGKIFDIDKKNNMPVRYGNAFQAWYLSENIVVKNCWIYQQFDAAVTFQGFGDSVPNFENIKFEDNLIEYCSMNFEFWSRNTNDETPPHIENILYKGNIIRFAGYGWGGIQRFKKGNQASLLGWNFHYDDIKNFVITDNILDCSDCYMIYMKSPKEQKGLSVYKNTYFQKAPSGLHECVEIVKGLDIRATNDKELKEAIATFDENPKLVKWLD